MPFDQDAAVACNALFCDGFEQQTGVEIEPPWAASTWQSDSLVQIDGEHVHSGSKAVRTSVTAGGAKRAMVQLQGSSVFPLTGNVMFGRAWLWLDGAPANGVHWTNIQGEGEVAGQNFRGYYRYGGMFNQSFMANYETVGVSSDCWKMSQQPIAVGAWQCVEWQFDGPTNTMRFWHNGLEVPDLTVTGQGEGCIGNDTGGQWLAPQFDTLNLGWEHYQDSAVGFSMWIDDVALGTSRIGCGP